MNRLEERIRTGLQATAERIPDTPPTTTVPRRRSARPAGVWIAVAAIAAVLILFTPLLLLDRSDTAAADPFLGTWVSIDGDLSTPIMEIGVSSGGAVEMTVVDEDLDDDFASVCSGASTTVIGTGALQSDNQLVIPSPVLTCDDGSQPRSINGLPAEVRLQNLTFTYRPDSDTLIDSFGERWTREGVQSTFHPMVRWPQASLEEVQEAQDLADAGDPNFTWQLEPNMESMDPGEVPELLAQAVQKRFGWEEVALVGISGEMESEGIRALGFQLVRCEPGKRSPLWPNDPVLGGCASTIDDPFYESVEIFVAQPAKQGLDGIWVVSSWPSEASVTQQAGDPDADNAQPTPGETSGSDSDRTTPPSDEEITDLMNSFVAARVNGEGAQQYLSDESEEKIPLLYATSSGAPYERAEFEQVPGIDWPYGQIAFMVRLFAGDTVVEQLFFMPHDDPIQFAPDGRLNLSYAPDGYATAIAPTTENGQPLALPLETLGGEVTLEAAHPWLFEFYPAATLGRLVPEAADVEPTTDSWQRHDWDEFRLVADPVVSGTGCKATSPRDAEALAERILSAPGVEGTAPATVRAGTAEGLTIDVAVAAGAPIRIAVDEQYNPCANELLNPILNLGEGSSMTVVEEGAMEGQATGERMRLYLFDMPDWSSVRTIAIAIVAPESRFERTVEKAAPVVDSIEFQTP